MVKRLFAWALLAAVFASGCASPGRVTQDQPEQRVPEPLPVSAEPPDPARMIPTLTFLTTTPEYDPPRYEAALYIKRAMAELGVDLDVRPTDQKVVTDTSRTAPWDWDIAAFSWGNNADRVDPGFYIWDQFHSSNIKDQGNNRVGYNNPEYDRIADAQKRAMDQEERRALVFQAQEILARDAAMFPLWYNDLDQVYNKRRLEGVVSQGGVGLINWLTMTRVQVKTGENILRVAHRQDLDHLNPLATVQATDRQILRFIYDSLLKWDENNQLIPGAAESWTIIDDTTVEFRLRPGQKFHDGHPLTAEDVAFTWNWGKQVGFGTEDPYVQGVEQVEVLDELTVRFKLIQPDSSIASSGFTAVPILPKHIWENIEDPRSITNEQPIGSGPFKLAYWRRGEEIRLDAVKDHYLQPKIDALIQIVYANPDALLGAMELGQADMINPGISPEQRAALEKNPDMEIVRTVGIGYGYVAVNMRRAPWSDVNFRRAMAYAINWSELAEVVKQGTARAAAPGMVISPTNKYYYNENALIFTYDPAKARQILQEAGYEWDENGRLYFPKQ